MKAGHADRRWKMGDERVGGKWKAGGGKGLSTFHLKPAPKRRAAFTLIELLGVMAIIGILAAVVLPPMISRIEDAQVAKEDATLETIADSLTRGIKSYGTFPNPNSFPDNVNNGWVTLAKNFFPKGINELRYVFPQAENFEATERRVYLDPLLVRYFTSSGSYAMPPDGYSTTSDLNANGIIDFDEALRMYIVSSSKRDLPLWCGKNMPSANMSPAPQDAGAGYGELLINDLLSWIKAPQPPGSVNAGAIMVPQSIARWGEQDGTQYRRGEFLHVKIVQLDKIFLQVSLTDCASPTTFVLASNSSGNPYVASTWYNVSDGYGTVCQFRSSTTGSGSGGINPTSSSRFLSDADGFNNRAATTLTSSFEIYASYSSGVGVSSANNAQVQFSLPGFPRYQLNAATPITFTASPQTVTFYVLAGTRLRLFNAAGSLLRDENIISDCKFKYWNGVWSSDD